MLIVSPPFGSYLQESQRRRKLGYEDFLVPRRIRARGKWWKIYRDAVKEAYGTYSRLIEKGVELEDARYVLPLSSKTSLFASGSLESFLALIMNAEKNGRESKWYPEELAILGEEIKRTVREVAPLLTDARLCFRIRLPTYPYANLYREENGLMRKIIEGNEVEKPTLLSMSVLVEDEKLVREALKDAAAAHVLNPLIQAVFLESMSLAAYHQSIRHRTITTAVEPIYSAMERCLAKPEKNLIIPPKIMRSEKLVNPFLDCVSKLLEAYQKLIEEAAHPSDSIYLAPQAVRIYVIKSYNAFNLLWPQGYVAMRTCSYSQWELRRIAYEVWKRVGERAPWLGKLMGERCKLLGYCPERKWCQTILKYREYNDEIHRKALKKMAKP